MCGSAPRLKGCKFPRKYGTIKLENNFLNRRNLTREFRNVCAIEGCSKGAWNEVCSLHAKRIRAGSLPEQLGVKHNPPCTYEGCITPKHTKKSDYCRFHYECSKTGTDPTTVRAKRNNSGFTNTVCRLEGCKLKTQSFGLCARHYNETRPGYKLPEPLLVPCSIESCPRKCSREKGTCSTHLRQLRVHGQTWNGPMPYELTREYRNSKKATCAVPQCEKLQAHLETPLCADHRNHCRKMTSGDEALFISLKSATSCDSCKITGVKLVIDHDHSCCNYGAACSECIRGMLCNGCNSLLGYAKDSQEKLQMASEYLLRWEQRM